MFAVAQRAEVEAVMGCSHGRRIIFDLSTSIRWSGPPVGIVRVERELARWALVNLTDVVFAGFDANEQRYAKIEREEIICGTASIELVGVEGSDR